MSSVAREIEVAGVRTRVWSGAPAVACAICGELYAEWRCDWPMEKQCTRRIHLAEVGDVWITKQSGKDARIVEIVNLNAVGEPMAAGERYSIRHIWVRLPGKKDRYPYVKHAGDFFRTTKPGVCAAPCCDAHVRDVGNDRHYCRDHWHSWEAA